MSYGFISFRACNVYQVYLRMCGILRGILRFVLSEVMLWRVICSGKTLGKCICALCLQPITTSAGVVLNEQCFVFLILWDMLLTCGMILWRVVFNVNILSKATSIWFMSYLTVFGLLQLAITNHTIISTPYHNHMSVRLSIYNLYIPADLTRLMYSNVTRFVTRFEQVMGFL